MKYGALLAILTLTACGRQDAPAVLGGAEEPNPQCLLDLADVHLKHHRLDDAFRLYRKSAALSPEPRILGRALFGCALVCLRRKEYPAATEYLSRASELADDPIPVRLLLAHTWGEAGHPDRAAQEYTRVLLDPKRRPEAAAQAIEELLKLYQGRPEVVREWEARTARSDDPCVLLFVARLHRDIAANPRRAAEYFERLHHKEPDRLEYVQSLLELYQQEKRLDRCRELCASMAAAAKDESSYAVWRTLQAEFLAQEGKYAEARSVLDAALSLDLPPAQKSSVRIARWNAMKHTGELTHEIERLGTHPEGRRFLLEIYEHVQPDARRFVEIAEALLKQQPGDGQLRLKCAQRYLALGRLAEAARAYQQAFEEAPELLPAHLESYIDLLARQERFDEAVSALNRIPQARSPLAPICAVLRLKIECHRRNEAAAQAQAEHLARLARSADTPDLALYLSSALKDHGWPRLALELLEELDRKPLNASLQARIRVQMIDACERMRDYAAAERFCRTLLGEAFEVPVRQAAERKLVELLHRQGKFAEMSRK